MKRAKRFLVVLLVFCMVLELIPTDWQRSLVNAAETEGVPYGSAFIIKSAGTDDLVLAPKTVVKNFEELHLETRAGVNAQKWEFTENGGHYVVRNIGTEFYLKCYGEVIDKRAHQNAGLSPIGEYQWDLEKVTDGTYAGGYKIAAVKKASGDVTGYVTAEGTQSGSEVFIRKEDTTHPEKQIWYFEEVSNVPRIGDEHVDEIVAAYLDKYSANDTGVELSSFGNSAEFLEVMLDGFETTGKEMYRNVFESSYRNLLTKFTTNGDASKNEDNSEILCFVIASVRAYLLFGDGNYLNYAKDNFEKVLSRGQQADKTVLLKADGETDSCVNGNAVIAACYLAKATGESSYYEKAKEIHNAQKAKMVNSETGLVKAAADEETAYPHNAGTWIGSCVMLYEHENDTNYLDDAVKTMNYAKDNFTDICGIVNWESNDGKTNVYRSVLMRYMRKAMITLYASNRDVLDFMKWTQKNAVMAYNNRNKNGFIQTSWQKMTADDAELNSTQAVSAVSLLINHTTYGILSDRSAFERIEAENFDYAVGIKTEAAKDDDGKDQVAGIKDDYYTVYKNIDFGKTGASAVWLRVSAWVDGGSVEIRMDRLDGPLLGTVTLTNTGGVNNYTTASSDISRICGVHTIYLVYKQKNKNDWVCNLNWLQFEEASDVDGPFWIKSDASEKYLICNESGSGKITASSGNREDWEKFDVIYNDDKTISLQAYVNEKYVRVVTEGDGAPYLIADSSVITDAEKFTIDSFGYDSEKFSLMAKENEKYLRVDPDSTDKVVAPTTSNTENVAAWETFHMEDSDGNWKVPSGAIGTFQVKYWKQNTSLQGYTEDTAAEAAALPKGAFYGTIGKVLTAPDLADKNEPKYNTSYDGFEINRDKSKCSGSVEPNGTLVLDVYYDRKAYNIKYSGIDGISNESGLTKTYRYGVKTRLIAAEKAGYIFDGWYSDAELKNPISEIGADTIEDITVYAKFTKIAEADYTVNYYQQKFDSTGTADSDYELKESKTIKGSVGADVTAQDPGYQGFTLNTGRSKQTGKVTWDGKLTLNMYYDRNTYKIHYPQLEEFENKDVLRKEYRYGAQFTMNAAIKDGYQFDGWYLEKELQNRFTGIKSTDAQDITVYAKFTPITSETTTAPYRISSFIQTKDGTGYDRRDTENLSGVIGASVEAPEMEGFEIDRTQGVASGTIAADGGLILRVYYNRKQYPVKYEGIEGIGNESELPKTYLYGAEKALVDAKKEGYRFDGWYSDAEHTNRITVISEEEAEKMQELTVYACFTKKADTPNAKLDYRVPGLSGLDPEAQYEIKIGDTPVENPVIDEDGNLKIDDLQSLDGVEISIVEKGRDKDGVTTCDSDPRIITVTGKENGPAPTEEDFDIRRPDGESGETDTIIKGITGEYEYRISEGGEFDPDGKDWQDGPGADEEIRVPAGESIEIRKKATETEPESESYTHTAVKLKKEETPNAELDYRVPGLSGLDQEAEYEITIGGRPVENPVVDKDGNLKIEDLLSHGTTIISVVKKGDKTTTADSEPQIILVTEKKNGPAPKEEDFDIRRPDGESEETDTIIKGITGEYEYRISEGGEFDADGKDWQDGPGADEEIRVPAGERIQIRKKATKEEPESDPLRISAPDVDGKTQEIMPNGVDVDYSLPGIKNLTAGKTYEVIETGGNGTVIAGGTADADGRLQIEDLLEKYTGKEISIVQKGDGTTTKDSAPETVRVKEKAETPTKDQFGIVEPTEKETDTIIQKITDEFEYRISEDGKFDDNGFKGGTGEDVRVPAGESIEIRKKETKAEQASDSLIIDAKKAEKEEPAKPDNTPAKGTAPSESQFGVQTDGSGTSTVIKNVTSEFEYSADGGKTWIPGNGKDITVPAGTVVLIRRKATATSAASDPIRIVTTVYQTLDTVDRMITSVNTDKGDVEGSTFAPLCLKASGKNKAVKLTWKKSSETNGYILYGSACGKNNKMVKLATLASSKKSYTVKKLNAKKLKAGTYYKFMIVAYKTIDGKDYVISKSKVAHAATTGSAKYGNPKKLKVNATKLSIKKGKKKTIKAKLTLTKAKMKKHIAKFRYESADPSIAAVTKKGSVKGIKAGKTYIYVYAQNGVYKRIKVTVK